MEVEAINIGPSDALASVETVTAIAGCGLEGDRHYRAGGQRPGNALTLIEAEALEAVREQDGIDLGDGRSRRQVTTRGIALNDLVGREFMVGGVRCRGVELCEPCKHLESLTEPGVIKAFVHRGGLRANILDGGTIAVGDPVSPS